MTNDQATLDNPVWHALTNQHATIALGDHLARRYPPDVAPFAAVATNSEDAFRSLATIIAPHEVIALVGSQPVNGDRWKLLRQLTLVQMVYAGPLVEFVAANHAITSLSQADVPAMLQLVELTKPGPFLQRTIELGHYLAIRQAGQLAAIAGERLHLPGFCEISAVCTHPTFQRRGYARQLILQLIQAIQSRGDLPFLHVMSDNEHAQTLYSALGFKQRAEVPLFVLKRQP